MQFMKSWEISMWDAFIHTSKFPKTVGRFLASHVAGHTVKVVNDSFSWFWVIFLYKKFIQNRERHSWIARATTSFLAHFTTEYWQICTRTFDWDIVMDINNVLTCTQAECYKIKTLKLRKNLQWYDKDLFYDINIKQMSCLIIVMWATR